LPTCNGQALYVNGGVWTTIVHPHDVAERAKQLLDVMIK
jgi:hypothetical protein